MSLIITKPHRRNMAGIPLNPANVMLHLKATSSGFVDLTGRTVVTGSPNFISSEVSLSNGERSISTLNNGYATFPYRADVAVSNSTWTMETRFMSPTSYVGTYKSLIDHGTYGKNKDFSFLLISGDRIRIFTSRTSSVYTTPVFAQLQPNVNYHVALVRNSGTLKIYLNGILVGTSGIVFSNETQKQYCIGCSDWNNPNSFANLYMNDVRFVRNEAVYTTDFVVPNALNY